MLREPRERPIGEGCAMAESRRVEIIPLVVPEPIEPQECPKGTAPWLLATLEEAGETLACGDVVVITSKVASLLEGHAVRLDTVAPSRKARRLARLLHRDPRKLELVLREGRISLVMPMHRISRIPAISKLVERLSPRPEDMREGYAKTNRTVFVIWKHGAFLDEGGIDFSNVRAGYVALLPPDPSRLAREIRAQLEAATGRRVGVILTDTTSNIERYGSRDIALGFAGLSPAARRLFDVDIYGIARSGGADLTADSIAALGGLIMGQKTERTPAVVIRGLDLPAADVLGVERLDELAIPPRAKLRATWYTVCATAWFHVANLLTCSQWPRPR